VTRRKPGRSTRPQCISTLSGCGGMATLDSSSRSFETLAASVERRSFGRTRSLERSKGLLSLRRERKGES
jgi:hypothetical protein